MEVYDTRAAGFSRRACSRFGYRDTGKMHGRSFYKGSSLGSYFARGYSDGQVLIWDLRDLKVRLFLMFHFAPRLMLFKKSPPQNAVTTLNCQRDAAVVHTVLSKRTVMAYGQRVVTFWNRKANAV